MKTNNKKTNRVLRITIIFLLTIIVFKTGYSQPMEYQKSKFETEAKYVGQGLSEQVNIGKGVSVDNKNVNGTSKDYPVKIKILDKSDQTNKIDLNEGQNSEFPLRNNWFFIRKLRK